jgi:hypothetical protein
MTYEHACLGRGPTDNNNSIPCFGFSVFSVIWGICFSLKANPNGMKTSDSGTVLAQGTRLLLQQWVNPLVRQFELAHWHTIHSLRPDTALSSDNRSHR